LADFLVSAPGYSEGGINRGKVYLYLGRRNINLLSREDCVYFLGEHAGNQAGLTLAPAGNLNGDDFDDFLIGAPVFNTTSSDIGKVYAIYGSDNLENADLVQAPVHIFGESSYDTAGHALSGGKDINGDGLDDIVIAAKGNNEVATDAGKVYVIYGSASLSSPIHLATGASVAYTGEAEGDMAGTSVALVDDLNEDGYAELFIGASKFDHSIEIVNEERTVIYEDTGKVYVITGSDSLVSGSLSDAEVSFLGQNQNDQAGALVTPAGDVNNDGVVDILIGADGYESDNGKGRVYLELVY
jgi:hypothetical protein